MADGFDHKEASLKSPVELEAILEMRAKRALGWFERQANAGPVRTCPVCDYQGRFAPVRHKPNIWCPNCDSRPRHRLLKLWLDQAALSADARVLHFAAEPWLAKHIAPKVGEYVTADINDLYDLQIDVTAMALPDNRFDVIIINHVLEHVDDEKALSEMHRVLAPNGLGVLTVPLVEGWDETYQDDTLDEAQRAEQYTDPVHLRMYGRDFRDRIRKAGFEQDEFTAIEPNVSRYGLHRGEKIFLGRKPAVTVSE